MRKSFPRHLVKAWRSGGSMRSSVNGWIASFRRFCSVRRLANCDIVRDERGVTSVEMAMIGVPFFGILFAIVETTMLLFANQSLDTALQDASRKIMTGQVQNGGINAAQFKSDVCARMTAFVNCSSGLYLDVKKYTVNAPYPAKPITAGAMDVSGFGFDPGCPSQIVVAKAAVEYPVYVSLLGNGLQELSNKKRVLMSTVSFRNEPYVWTGAPMAGC
jgi:Flp pilus assembly protein TadG